MDANEVANLLHIAEKTLQWPKLKPIHDAAMQLLERHAEEWKENAEQPEQEPAPAPAPEPEPAPAPEPPPPDDQSEDENEASAEPEEVMRRQP